MLKQLTLFLFILTLPIYGTGQICIEFPPINGEPAAIAAPDGWTIWTPSPDIIAGEGPWPGGVGYVVSNIEGISPGGAEMSLILGVPGAFPYFEGIQTVLTGLTIGETYSISIGWQQVNLENDLNTYRAGKLSLTVDGAESIFTSIGDVTDEWQIATVEFVAIGATALYQCRAYWDGLTYPYEGLAIVVDDAPCAIPALELTVAPDTICSGDCVELVATTEGGVGDILIEWNPDIAEVGSTITVCPEVTTEYEVIASDEGGQVDTVYVTVVVYDNPVVDLGPDLSLSSCIEDSVVLDAGNPGASYEWQDGSADQFFTVTEAGEYSVVVENEFGCTGEDEVIISEENVLSLELLVNNPSCYGFSDGSITINVVGGTGELLFEIRDEADNLMNEDNSNTANTLSEGWYYIFVDDESDCEGRDSVLLIDPAQLEIDLTTFEPLCYGDLTGWVKVDSVYNAAGDYDSISFIWNPNPAGIEGVGADSSYAMGGGNYTLTINDQNGCSRTFDIVITNPDSLYFSEFGFDPAYCRLFGYQSGNGVVFGAAAGGTPDYDYLWTNLTNGETSINSTWGGLNPANYLLTVTDANGCVLTNELFLDSLNPIADFTVNSAQLNSDLKGTAPVEVVFTNQSENFVNPNNPLGDTTFFWNLNTPTADWEISYDWYETKDTTYLPRGESYTVNVCLVAINQAGCTDTACKIITIFEPIAFTDINIFSPNNDGINDVFSFDFRSASIATFSCVIVNRWGTTIYEMDEITDFWDGTTQAGEACSDGVYFYTYHATTDNGTLLNGQGTVQLVK